jgi:hypothetical protein
MIVCLSGMIDAKVIGYYANCNFPRPSHCRRFALAAMLSIVGYHGLRTSHAPEALLKRADDLSWLRLITWQAVCNELYQTRARVYERRGTGNRS